MTDLILSEESKQYQDLARDFFQNEVAAKSEQLDHEGVYPAHLYKAAWELGLASTLIPEDFGGLGLPLWDCAVMAEEAGAASGGVAAVFEANSLACAPILVAGTEQQKQTYLSKLAEEPALAGFCFPSAADSFSPFSQVKVSAKGKKFILNSKSLLAANGENAAWYFVIAQDEDSGAASAFVFPSDMPGITRGAQIQKLGRRCSDICKIELENLELGEEHLLGRAGQGRSVIAEANCISATIVAAHATGLMRCGLEHCIRYSKERQTFGKPIAKHQAIGFMIADMAKNTQCARLMSWKAASLFDQSLRDQIQALCAKSFAIDAAMVVATDAVQVYGGYGYSKEYPVERLMRDAKMMQMMAGSSFELKCTIGEEQLALSCS